MLRSCLRTIYGIIPRMNAKSRTWERKTLCKEPRLGTEWWGAALRKGPRGPGGQQAGQDPAVSWTVVTGVQSTAEGK